MPSDSERVPLESFPDIDLSSAMNYMQRHDVGRLSLTIEALDVREDDLGSKSSALAVVELKSMTDLTPPSSFGLDGVFFICAEDDNNV